MYVTGAKGGKRVQASHILLWHSLFGLIPDWLRNWHYFLAKSVAKQQNKTKANAGAPKEENKNSNTGLG